MIVAGYSGVGKTTFAKTHQNVIDLHVMPYKYSNLSELNNKYNDESIKAAPELILNIDWRYDYYDKLISLYKSEPNKIIVIPTDIQIMNWLERWQMSVAFVFICIGFLYAQSKNCSGQREKDRCSTSTLYREE